MDVSLTNEVKGYAEQIGADLVGIADLERVNGIPTIPAELLNGYTRAVVIAFQVSPAIFVQMEDEPTPLYAQQYTAINQLLDQINLRLQSLLLKKGYSALALPASQTVDRENHRGHISSKALAVAAGLGWQGKSLLLVTPQYGPRVRIACLLTDAPLMVDDVVPNQCGNCTKCKNACPAKAIYGTAWQQRMRMREEAVDIEKCVSWVTEMAKKPGIGSNICGICIKVCPWGQRKGK